MAKSTCGKCKSVFSSLSSFDMHRVGSFQERDRRCLNTEEMQELEMRQNSYGQWTCGGDFGTFSNKFKPVDKSS